MISTNYLKAVSQKDPQTGELTVGELACAIYEGMPHVQNLAEKMARQHGKADALTWFDMMGEDVQNYFFHIAQQLIDFGKGWQENNGSCCVSTEELRQKLKELPRHPELNTQKF